MRRFFTRWRTRRQLRWLELYLAAEHPGFIVTPAGIIRTS